MPSPHATEFAFSRFGKPEEVVLREALVRENSEAAAAEIAEGEAADEGRA